MSKITTVCYNEEVVWSSRENAKAFFLEAMKHTEGAEHDRYSQIYTKLCCGDDYCTDEGDN